MKKRKAWSLARVGKACKAAGLVWLALKQIAKEEGTRVVCPTRKKLCKRSGVRDVKTITLALNTLEAAKWIDRAHFPSSRPTGERVTLLKIVLLLYDPKNGSYSGRSIRPEKRKQVSTRKTDANSPTERGGGPNGPALSLSVGSEPSRPSPYSEPEPIVAKQPVDKKPHNVEHTA